MDRLRVGIAGAGWVAGTRHLPSYVKHPAAQVITIYDRCRSRAQQLARQASAKSGSAVRATDDLSEFLDADLDLVSVATSPWSHAEISIAALERGANVFTEKPMAMHSADAQAMASAAVSAGRLLCVSHNFLFSSSLIQADRSLAGAKIDYAMGLQLSAESRRRPTWYQGLPGGLMFEEAPHMLYTLNHYLGGGLQLDHARGTFNDDGHPRTIELMLRGRSGLGQITMVFCAPVSEWHVMLSSQRRAVALDLFRDIEVELAPDGAHGALDIARSSAALVGGHIAGFAKASARFAAGRQFWGHDVLIGTFVDTVAFGGRSPVPMEDALGVVRLTDDVLEALDLRAKVSQ